MFRQSSKRVMNVLIGIPSQSRGLILVTTLALTAWAFLYFSRPVSSFIKNSPDNPGGIFAHTNGAETIAGKTGEAQSRQPRRPQGGPLGSACTRTVTNTNNSGAGSLRQAIR